MKQQGISLLELLIVLSIVGILFAYALPNYSQHLVQERRLVAATSLMKLAGHLETYFAEHNTYEGANFSSLQLPEFVADNNYHLVLASSAEHYKITAIPQGEQARHDGLCGGLTMNSKGVKMITGYGTLNQCW